MNHFVEVITCGFEFQDTSTSEGGKLAREESENEKGASSPEPSQSPPNQSPPPEPVSSNAPRADEDGELSDDQRQEEDSMKLDLTYTGTS